MKALVFNVITNSLFSIRIPFTWQSALTYPILPPSAIIGMCANALQRYKNSAHPLVCLDLLEDEVAWAGSKCLTPCVTKSYITSAMVKWEDNLGGKFTNALGREYAYSRSLQVVVIFNGGNIVGEVGKALKVTPLTCGDTESPISLLDDVHIKDVFRASALNRVRTEYPVPFTKDTDIVDGNGKTYLMHERCKKRDSNHPVRTYMIPLREERKILVPSFLTVHITNEKPFEVEGTGYIITR